MATEVILRVKQRMEYNGQIYLRGDEWKPEGLPEDEKIFRNMVTAEFLPVKAKEKKETHDKDHHQ
jgi:hypothetical protein